MISHATDNSLKMLKEELELTLQRVQSDLESYLENPADETVLDSMAEGIDQIRGAFAKFDQTDAVLLTEETITLARELAHTKMEPAVREQRLTVLLRAVLQVPQYLQWLQRGSKQPFDLLPMINQMRAARGLPPVGAKKVPAFLTTAKHPVGERGMRKLAVRLRPLLQRALLGMLRGQAATSEGEIVSLFSQFKAVAGSETSYHFWWLAEGLARELQNGDIASGRDINLLLRDLDNQVKYLLESGKLFPDEGAAETFSRRLINHLSSSSTGLARLQNRTDYQPPLLGQPTSLSMPASVSPLDVETLLRITDVLKESLALIKDAVDRLANDSQRRTGSLQAELERLHEAANILTVLNMDVSAQLIQRHLKIFQQWLAGSDRITDKQITKLACELILVEDSLEGVAEFAYNQKLAAPATQGLNDADRAALVIMDFQRQQARRAVTQETITLLRGAQESVASCLNAGAAVPPWEELQSVLRGVSGILAVLERGQAVTLTQRLVQVVHNLAAARTVQKSAPLANAFADILITLEYYLEMLGEGREPNGDILAHAESQFRLLEGIAVLPPDVAEAPEPLPAEPAEAATLADSEVSGLPHDVTAEIAELGMIELPDLEPTRAFEDSAAATTAASSPAVPAAPAGAGSGVDPEFVEIFLEEAREELVSIGKQLAIWRNNLGDKDALTSIRRSFHTLKGSGRMVEHYTIGDFAWCFENLLNRVLDGTLTASFQLVEALAEAQAALETLVNGGPEKSAALAETLTALTQRAEALVRGEVPAEGLIAPVITATPAPAEAVITPVDVVSEETITKPIEEGAPAIAEATEELLAEPATAVQFPAKTVPAPAEVDLELIEIFQYEAAEILDASDDILARWNANQSDDDLLNDLRREMHTLKGSSRMAGFMAIGDLAHAMESILDIMSKHSVRDASSLVEALQQALDRLNGMLAAVRSGAAISPATDLIADLKDLVASKTLGEKALPTREQVPVEPLESAAETVAAAAVPTLVTADKPSAEVDPELVKVFLFEAAEILDASDVILQGWRADLENVELLNDLRREMHTLKGSSRMAGFSLIGDLAHAMESVLDVIGKGAMKASATVVDALQRALDGLNDMMARVQGGREIVPASDLISDLKGMLGVAPTEQPVAIPAPPSAKTTEKAVAAVGEDTIRVSSALLNTLVNEMGESSIYRARIDQGVGSLRFNLSELNQTVFRLRQQLRRLEIETETQIRSRYEDASKDHQKYFDPLELDRFSELQQLSRSLLESVDDLTNLQGTLEEQAQEMSFLLEQQGKVNKEVQQGLMRTRMVRFSSIAPRLRRVVRQAAQELGKSAELVLEGSEAEVDRTILENILAPLEHMLRNSISHGIEEPERRRAAGKPETGAITLAMRREGGELVLTLSDDGAGLNFEAIRAKGEANGLLKPGESVTEDELIALLLRPGFSTATKVTQISGRGVGMDVLNDAIKSMRGALLIRSHPGRGTNFTIRLPFSLAVTQALLVQVGGDTYAVPLLSIESVVRLNEGEMQTYLSGESVDYKFGEYSYPLHNLGILFGAGNLATNEGTITDKRPAALLFRSAEASAALQVDAVLSNQEIIVKPVAPQFQSVTGLSGATVLADGRVVVVLDLAALVRNLASQSRKQAEARTLYIVRQQSYQNHIRAMVIDDSITMRKVTSRFLERHNIDATTAKDGLEAVTKLEEQIPDLVILDIEMPRMDGFEVATHIRNQPHLKKVPIIMVTSRGGEKHRERAAKIGVNAYLTKPYQEEEMLNTIRSVLSEQGLDLLI